MHTSKFVARYAVLVLYGTDYFLYFSHTPHLEDQIGVWGNGAFKAFTECSEQSDKISNPITSNLQNKIKLHFCTEVILN